MTDVKWYITKVTNHRDGDISVRLTKEPYIQTITRALDIPTLPVPEHDNFIGKVFEWKKP